MNIDSAFSDFIKAADLGNARPTVTIESVEIEKVGEDKKPVVRFRGKEKRLALNRTNANMISEICGTAETDHWRGRQIVLYASKTDYAGKRVDCVRVDYPAAPPQQHAAPPQAAPPPPAPVYAPPTGFVATDDDVPF